MPDYYFDDLKPGFRIETEPVTVTEEEIIAFAHQWDPQSFHLDAEAASKGPYGGLIASGWQTVLIMFRRFLDLGLIRESSMGSPGVDELRWYRPVRPGDQLRMVAEVLESRPSKSKPDRGIIRMRQSAVNQDGEEVASMIGMLLLRRRPE